MTVYATIFAMIMTLGGTIIFPVIFRPVLRFNIVTTTAIAAIVYAAVELAYRPFSPICDNRPALMAVYSMSILIYILLIRTDKIIDALIINCFYEFLYNIIGTATITILTVIYGAASGADSSTWFSFSTSTATDYVIRCISLILCLGISLIICRKCMPLMSNLNRRLKLTLFMGTVVPLLIFMIIRHAVDPNKPWMMAGPMVICYGILLMLMAVSLLIFFINVFLHTREENRLVQAGIEAQSEHYRRVLRIQQELREAKHDLANRLVAYNISQNTDKRQERI